MGGDEPWDRLFPRSPRYELYPARRITQRGSRLGVSISRRHRLGGWTSRFVVHSWKDHYFDTAAAYWYKSNPDHVTFGGSRRTHLGRTGKFTICIRQGYVPLGHSTGWPSAGIRRGPRRGQRT